jgi:PqqD family protein of HPr-rel-A system
MPRYGRIGGLCVEAVGQGWVAYSPASGETALINDASAAILEVLESGPATSAQVAAQLAADSGADNPELLETVQGCWTTLIDAGLVRACAPVGGAPQ